MAALDYAAIEEDWSDLEWPELDRWPDLPRAPAKLDGQNRIMLGRKFCGRCGRWRLINDYRVIAPYPGGSPRFRHICLTCEARINHLPALRKPYSEALSKDEAIYAAPFFRWFDAWIERHKHLWVGNIDSYATPIVTEHTIMEAVGSSGRALYRARKEGRISLALVDRILVLLDADVQLWELGA